MKRIWHIPAIFGIFCFVATVANAQEKAPLSISIPEKMINEALKGQTWEGEGVYYAGVGGEIPYQFTLSEASCQLKKGYAQINATTEITTSGYTYKEQITGRVKLKFSSRTEKIQVRVENLIVPIYASFFGSRKKVGEIDLASSVDTLEVEPSQFMSQAASLLPAGKEVKLTNISILPGVLQVEFVLVEAKKKTP